MIPHAANSADYAAQDDFELISRYRGGDEAACAVLLARYANLINRRISSIGIAGSDDDDLRQEAYMGLMGAIRSYDPAKGVAFSAYAARCIGNRIKNLFAAASTGKARLNRQTLSLDDLENDSLRPQSATDPESIFLGKEAYCEVWRLVDRTLSEFEWAVLYSYLSGHDYKDIAAKLHSSLKSVDNALQRVRRKLKAVLNDL